jgi:hypothetical protein
LVALECVALPVVQPRNNPHAAVIFSIDCAGGKAIDSFQTRAAARHHVGSPSLTDSLRPRQLSDGWQVRHRCKRRPPAARAKRARAGHLQRERKRGVALRNRPCGPFRCRIEVAGEREVAAMT